MHYKLNLAECDYFTEFNIKSNLRIYKFLESCDIDKFTTFKIPADASKRQYYKVVTANKNYVLMDSSREIESCIRFVRVCEFLKDNHFSVPEIYCEDTDKGFLLLEDFGNNICAKYINKNPKKEVPLYEDCIDLLTELHKVNIPSFLEEYSVKKLKSELDIFKDWYLKYNIAPDELDKALEQFDKLMEPIALRCASNNNAIALKDFMADNIMVLPERDGIERLGLLDFQDAVVGSKYHDLTSLLQDARRDVSKKLEKQCLNRYIKSNKIKDVDNFMQSYNVCALQKNLRIIGVFHRLNLRYGKTKYLQYLPRMWKYVERNLEADNLLSVKQWFKKYGIPKTV